MRLIGTAAIVLGLCVPAAFAQDHDRIDKIEPGTKIEVRTNETIDVEHRDDRIYRGIVERDVGGENGRLAIPRSSRVELKVRVAPDNDLILDLESVSVDGVRYTVKADADRVEAAQVRGHVVKVPHDSVLTFRIDRLMTVGSLVPDPGVSLYARQRR
jgi:hypothetical protein